MKKTIIMLLAVMMLFAFTACNNGTPAPEDWAIKLDTDGTLGVDNTPFPNSSTVKLNTTDGKNYVVTGDLAKMSQEQADAWIGISKDSQHVALEITTGVNASTRRGWVTEADANKAVSELNDDAFKVMAEKDITSDEATWTMILAVTDGETLRPEIAGNPIWRVEITEANKEPVVYTVDMSEYFTTV